jgi:hypothetical protein
MRFLAVSFTIALALSFSAPARAQPSNTAVFDFEMIDTSLEGEMHGARTEEQARLKHVGDVLRKGLAESDKFIIIDIVRSRQRRLAPTSRSPERCRKFRTLSLT